MFKIIIGIFLAVMIPGFILFCFMINTSSKECAKAYGNNWSATTKGQFYCKNNTTGELRDTP